MGVLSASGVIGEDGSMPPAPVVEEPAGAAEPAATTEPAAAEAPSDYQPGVKRPGSRRAKADELVEERIKTHLGEFEKRWTTERQTLEQRLSQEQQERARLAGALETLQRMPQQPPAPVKDDRPDPTDLRRQAKKALDDKDFESYERLRDEATLIDADRRAEARMTKVRTELEGKIPQQIPPVIQHLLSRHQHVAMAGPRGEEAVVLKDRELALYGHQPGPERMAKAFELADKMLAPQQQQPARPTYSRDAAAALSAVPAGRPPGGGGGGGSDPEPLTALEKATARSAGMSEDDYRKWKSPEKFVRR
jgi:hypothetical protein